MATIEDIVDATEFSDADQLVGVRFDNYGARKHDPLGDDEYEFTVRSVDPDAGTITLEWEVVDGQRVRASEEDTEEVKINDPATLLLFEGATPTH